MGIRVLTKEGTTPEFHSNADDDQHYITCEVTESGALVILQGHYNCYVEQTIAGYDKGQWLAYERVGRLQNDD